MKDDVDLSTFPEVLPGVLAGIRRDGCTALIVPRYNCQDTWSWNTLGADGYTCSVTRLGYASRVGESPLDIVAPLSSWAPRMAYEPPKP